MIERVESLVTNSYLSQVSLKLSLKEWAMKELIPVHLYKKGIIDDIPSEFDRHYHPTAQDLRNMTKGVINKIRKNTFDKDALKILLQDEAKQHPGFQYFLRKRMVCIDYIHQIFNNISNIKSLSFLGSCVNNTKPLLHFIVWSIFFKGALPRKPTTYSRPMNIISKKYARSENLPRKR